MIMSFLVFKQPLQSDQIGMSLNEQMLDEYQLEEEKVLSEDKHQIEKIFRQYNDDYVDPNESYEDSGEEEETEENAIRRKGAFVLLDENQNDSGEWDEVKEKANRVMIKSLTPSSDQLE